MTSTRVDQAADLMTRFAARTGLAGPGQVRRYLWTDAFAVCNFLALWRTTGEHRWCDQALALVDQVHHTLGRHRPDDTRTGWISGVPEAHGAEHPTLGGLRIGKPLPERGAAEPFDQRQEWDRDGQYFHYLTRWMHALDQVARATGDPRFNVWARELAEAAWRGFVYSRADRRRMNWKMSIDLSRPLVPSMGHHDPLDGLVTCIELEETAADTPARGPDLSDACADYTGMLELDELITTDPLGIGGLYADASRVEQLMKLGAFSEHTSLHDAILRGARDSLHAYVIGGDLEAPAESRLAFRELGLAIGLTVESTVVTRRLRDLIIEFWLDEGHRGTATYHEHQDINDVMLATALVPDGYLVLHPFASTRPHGVASRLSRPA